MNVELLKTDDEEASFAGPESRAIFGSKTAIMGYPENRHPVRSGFPIVDLVAKRHIHRQAVVLGGGQSRETSLIKLAGETAERHAMYLNKPAHMEQLSYREAQQKYENVIDFEYIDIYEPAAVDRSEYERIDKDSEVYWTTQTDILTGIEWHLPSQLIGKGRNEPQYRLYSSNGGACGSTRVQALLNSLYEYLERDGFLRAWYTEQGVREIDTQNLPTVSKLKRELGTDALHLRLIELPSPDGIATVGCAVSHVDDIIPKFHICFSADCSIQAACRDALLEAAQIWRTMQQSVAKNNHKEVNDPDEFFDLMAGADYYANPERYDELSVLVEDRPTISPTPVPEPETQTDELAHVLTVYDRNDYRLFVEETTTPGLEQIGFHTVQTAVPDLVPMSLPSLHPTRHPRLATEQTHTRPHPFA